MRSRNLLVVNIPVFHFLPSQRNHLRTIRRKFDPHRAFKMLWIGDQLSHLKNLALHFAVAATPCECHLRGNLGGANTERAVPSGVKPSQFFSKVSVMHAPL